MSPSAVQTQEVIASGSVKTLQVLYNAAAGVHVVAH